jgi:DNA integrity scanning protein DisA with diadenylate cyclase activity
MTKAKQVIEEIELTANEHNQLIWAEIEKYQDEIELMKLELRPAELPKQVSLNDCNIMAGKIKLEVNKVDPKRLQEERTGA